MESDDWGHMGSFLFDQLLRTRQVRVTIQRGLTRMAWGLAVSGVLLLGLAGYDIYQQGFNERASSSERRLLTRLARDEAATSSETQHTRDVQVRADVAGSPPVAVCLLEGVEHALPALTRLPGARVPLSEYVRLQRERFAGIRCPTPPKSGRP